MTTLRERLAGLFRSKVAPINEDPTFVFERCLQIPDCTERYLNLLIDKGFEFSGDRADDTHEDRVRMIREAVALAKEDK